MRAELVFLTNCISIPNCLLPTLEVFLMIMSPRSAGKDLGWEEYGRYHWTIFREFFLEDYAELFWHCRKEFIELSSVTIEIMSVGRCFSRRSLILGGKQMRVFLVSHSSANTTALPSSRIWYINLNLTFKQMGVQLLLPWFDVAEQHLVCVYGRSDRTPAETCVYYSHELLKDAKKEEKKVISIYFSVIFIAPLFYPKS